MESLPSEALLVSPSVSGTMRLVERGWLSDKHTFTLGSASNTTTLTLVNESSGTGSSTVMGSNNKK